MTDWHFLGLGFKGCQNLRLAHFPGVGRGLQAAGAASSLQFRGISKCWRSIFDENSAVSPEDIKAGEVLVSIPLPALVTRYFVSLKLTESFQCVLYPGQPFFKPIHILLDRTCPHRFIDLNKNVLHTICRPSSLSGFCFLLQPHISHPSPLLTPACTSSLPHIGNSCQPTLGSACKSKLLWSIKTLKKCLRYNLVPLAFRSMLSDAGLSWPR